MSEVKMCFDGYNKCGKVATVEHWDCCDGYYGLDLCADCAETIGKGGSTGYCDWSNAVDGVIISSSNPDEVGMKF